MNTVAVIEARMGSTRLPGKTMMDISGKSLLERVIERIKPATLSRIVVATSVGQNDDIIYEKCMETGILCYRGSEHDVLDRVYRTALEHSADIVVQCGADCPFYDPELIDLLVNVMKWGGYSYTANDMKLTYPAGVDAHVIRFDALEAAAMESIEPRDREDTPRFLWSKPERFPVFNLEALPGSPLNRPDIRLTIDYEEDIVIARHIYSELYPSSPRFTTFELIKFLNSRPELIEINRYCKQHSAPYIT